MFDSSLKLFWSLLYADISNTRSPHRLTMNTWLSGYSSMLRIFINSFFPSPFGETALKTSIPRSPRLAATVKKAKAGDCVLVTEPEVSVPVRLDCPRLEYDPVDWLLPATTSRSKLSVNPSSPETERL